MWVIATTCGGGKRPRLIKANTPTRIAALIDSFLELYNKCDSDIVDWAKQWGVLGLCGCGRPVLHDADATGISRCKEFGYLARGYKLEPCDRYRDYSAQLRAVMTIVSCIQDGRPGSKRNREILAKEMQLARFTVHSDDRTVVSYYLNFMLSQSGVRPELQWFEGNRPELTMWNQACVLGQIVGRFAFRVAGADTISLCVQCEKPILFEQYRKGRKGKCRACVRREQYAKSKRKTRALARKP